MRAVKVVPGMRVARPYTFFSPRRSGKRKCSGSYSFNPATPDNFPANSLFGIYGDLTSLALALLTIPGLFWWTRRTRHIGS